MRQVRRSGTLMLVSAVGAIVLTAATTGPAGAARNPAPPGGWGTAQEVPGPAALRLSDAEILSVSCASAGNCSAGGDYGVGQNRNQAFVVNETNGIWGGAIEVPGTVTLNQGGNAGISSVSCRSAGHCSAGGEYMDSSNLFQVFVVNET